MARPSRARLLWDEMKTFAGEDVRAFLRGSLEGVRDRIDGLKDRADEMVTHIQDLEQVVPAIDARVRANTTKAGQLETAVAGKANVAHTHARADVQGLPAILNGLDARLTAVETAVAQIKAKLGIQ